MLVSVVASTQTTINLCYIWPMQGTLRGGTQTPTNFCYVWGNQINCLKLIHTSGSCKARRREELTLWSHCHYYRKLNLFEEVNEWKHKNDIGVRETKRALETLSYTIERTYSKSRILQCTIVKAYNQAINDLDKELNHLKNEFEFVPPISSYLDSEHNMRDICL